jgi:hypothetical protein
MVGILASKGVHRSQPLFSDAPLPTREIGVLSVTRKVTMRQDSVCVTVVVDTLPSFSEPSEPKWFARGEMIFPGAQAPLKDAVLCPSGGVVGSELVSRPWAFAGTGLSRQKIRAVKGLSRMSNRIPSESRAGSKEGGS